MSSSTWSRSFEPKVRYDDQLKESVSLVPNNFRQNLVLYEILDNQSE